MLHLTVLVVLQLSTGTLFAGPSSQPLNNDHSKVILDLPWRFRASAIKEFIRPRPAVPSRKFLMSPYQFSEDLVPARRAMTALEENEMKVKLFRIMFASVKECDLKMKKAEVMKDMYTNSTAFETGYLLGKIINIHNDMTDILSTMKRLYHEWKPVEHVNAYDEIANQANEISHLIDIMKSVHRRNLTLRTSNRHFNFN